MNKRTWALVLLGVVCWARPAHPTALQLTSADTALLFGGTDAEGGIGDWYVSNGVIEAIIDNVGPRPDLVGVVPPGTEPPIQSEIAFTGGTIIDLGRVGLNNDQLNQIFTVGGLSTSNFLVYSSITTVGTDTIRATGKVLFPPTSVQPSPCLDVVTDYTAAGSDPFLTVTSVATNNCGVNLPSFGGFLDVAIWTLRSNVPFSGGGVPPFGGKGFNHSPLNLSNPVLSLEIPTLMAAPGAVKPADGIMDTANSTSCGEVSYGLVGVQVEVDPDGPGGLPPTTTAPVNTLFGVSSNLVTALGNPSLTGPPAGGTLTYTRRLYVGDRNDVRSVGDAMWAVLAPRVGFSTGTMSGDVDAADTASVEASIIVTRIGNCSLNTSISCKVNADCTGSGTCVDPVPTTGQAVNTATTHIRTDATGAFSGVTLPQGNYELRVSSAERDDVVVSPVTVGAGNTAPIIPALTARGTVAFNVRERTSGLPPLPAKLTFKGVSPTTDPRFNKDLVALLGTTDLEVETFGGTQAGSAGSAAGQFNNVYTTGSGSIQVRPGTYDIYASRGLEYSVMLQRVTVAAGGTTNVDFRLKRSVRTRNAISADFHVHSGRSLDTHAALRDRVLAFAGEGLEVMVSTDHDKNVDYAPLITGFGIGSRITSIIGNELTGSVPNPPDFPNSYGHINAWPVVVDADQPRDGAIEDEYTAPNWIYKQLRDAGADVIQYNHPRAGVSGLTTIGIFNNIGCNRCANDIDMTCVVDTDCPALPAPRDCTCVGYQPDRVITMAPNDILLDDGVRGPGTTANPDGLDNLAFDVMEIANGARDGDFPSLRQVRRDWLSLLNQGIFRGGTAVSDSHRITIEHAGWARSFVFGVGDDPATLNVGNFDTEVKGGNMVMSAGPYMEVSARGAGGVSVGLGQLLPAPDGRVRLRIKVKTPVWIPVEEVRIIANGFQVAAYDTTTIPRVKPVPTNFQRTGSTSRFRASVSFTVTQDTYFIVEAGVKLPADPNDLPPVPPVMDIVVPGVVPIAIANPIFVDRDGNSTFDPPGLPVMMASAAPAALPTFAQVHLESPSEGLWERLWDGLTRLAARFTGEAMAQRAPGEMTGVTKEKKQEAIEKGEYFPIYEFSIPTEAMEEARRRDAEARRQAGEKPAAEPDGK